MFERFSRNARVSVVLAQEEARELDADEIRPEHLLVGVLQSAGRDLSSLLGGYGLTADAIRDRLAAADSPGDESFDDDAEALRSIGIDLRAVRDSVARTFGAHAFDNALRSPAGAGVDADTSRSPSRPRRCSSWHCGKRWRTRTVGSAASTSCSASCAAVTNSRSA